MHIISFDDFKKTTAFFQLRPCKAIFVFIVSLFAILALLFIWAFFAPMDDIVHATALLRPASSVSSVRCINSGEVVQCLYKNGQEVNEGDMLFSLDTKANEAELEALQKQLDSINEEIFMNENLLKTINTEKIPNIDIETQSYAKCHDYILQKETYEATLLEANIQIKRENEKHEMIKVRTDMEDLIMKRNKTDLQFRTWKNQILSATLEEKQNLKIQHDKLQSSISQVERNIKNSIITAPISGKITEVQKINVGDYIIGGSEIIRIVPQNSESLKAEIYIDSNDIAKVKEGNPVKIRFQSLPPSQYGQVETKISLIPPDATLSENGFHFNAEALISDSYLTAKNGRRAKLIPGISADVRIVTERSTVLKMVLRKLEFVE